jgi:hypothetical protein
MKRRERKAIKLLSSMLAVAPNCARDFFFLVHSLVKLLIGFCFIIRALKDLGELCSCNFSAKRADGGGRVELQKKKRSLKQQLSCEKAKAKAFTVSGSDSPNAAL